tara:strand:+ start:1927 stop:2265 length:339 start_codon:yes stop_codon:yes gene_type:complete
MLFTPYENKKSGKTIRMNISKADMDKWDKLPSRSNKKTITVKNLKNGKKYVVRRADCGAGCYCAGEVVRIVKPTTTKTKTTKRKAPAKKKTTKRKSPAKKKTTKRKTTKRKR